LLDSGIFVPHSAAGTAWSVARHPLLSSYTRDVHCLTADWINHSLKYVAVILSLHFWPQNI